MTTTAKTAAEAREIAAGLRRDYAGTDWTVTIHAPLFEGDTYRVVVG